MSMPVGEARGNVARTWLGRASIRLNQAESAARQRRPSIQHTANLKVSRELPAEIDYVWKKVEGWNKCQGGKGAPWVELGRVVDLDRVVSLADEDPLSIAILSDSADDIDKPASTNKTYPT